MKSQAEWNALRDEMADARYPKNKYADREEKTECVWFRQGFREGFDARHAISSSDITREDVMKLVEALGKIADPTKMDHREPDLYTKYGCLINVAYEALATFNEKYGEK